MKVSGIPNWKTRREITNVCVPCCHDNSSCLSYDFILLSCCFLRTSSRTIQTRTALLKSSYPSEINLFLQSTIYINKIGRPSVCLRRFYMFVINGKSAQRIDMKFRSNILYTWVSNVGHLRYLVIPSHVKTKWPEFNCSHVCPFLDNVLFILDMKEKQFSVLKNLWRMTLP